MSLSNITLTASVRQNLLSLQGTADLLATTQGRLATGKKVNSALDNPTNLTNAGTTTLQGKTLIFKTASGTTTLTIDNTAGAGKVNSIDSINTALAAAGVELQATFNSNGSVAFTSTNNAASQTITATGTYAAPPAGSSTSVDVSGTATFGAVTAAVTDAVSQATRANLVSQYNQIITQITTTAQDASFNGINLLNGDSLKLVFNETGKSTSTISGVTFNPAGLGLAALTSGTAFVDNAATNTVLSALNTASISLRSQASAFGANLSIVQIRQDFNKNIINVLQTGSSALTLADSNEEAANSQALSPRPSMATSALSPAHTPQPGVL